MRLFLFLATCLVVIFVFLAVHLESRRSLPVPAASGVSQVSKIRRPRLVLVYATCSLNKDYLSPYNASVNYTPNIGAFAKQSVVFARHETEVGFSGPAFASLFTGLSVFHHHVYYHPAILSNDLYTMAEAFRDNNYETFFWNAHQMTSPTLNYAQGVPPQNISYGPLSVEDPKFESLLWHLKNSDSYNAYLQTTFTFTHSPYSSNSDSKRTGEFCDQFPKECAGITSQDLEKYLQLDQKNHLSSGHPAEETARALGLNTAEMEKLTAVLEAAYKSSVHLVDAHFGKLIERIKHAGIFDDSLIVFTSDHGELLYRKGAPISWTHAGVEPEVLDISLIVHPQTPIRPHLYEKVTRSMDVLPTLIGLSGFTGSSHTFDGHDLSKAIAEQQPCPDLIAFACSGMLHPSLGADNPSFMIVQARQGDKLYRYTPAFAGRQEKLQIFDTSVERNPRELPFNARKETFPYVLLQQYRDSLIRHFGETRDDGKWEEARERLRALGYLQ